MSGEPIVLVALALAAAGLNGVNMTGAIWASAALSMAGGIR